MLMDDPQSGIPEVGMLPSVLEVEPLDGDVEPSVELVDVALADLPCS